MKFYLLVSLATLVLCSTSALAKKQCIADIEYTFLSRDSHTQRLDIDAKSKKECIALAKKYELNPYPSVVKKKKVLAKWEDR